MVDRPEFGRRRRTRSNAIKEISGTIESLSEISATITAAVEEQGGATQEISRNVQQVAQGTQQVSSNITDARVSAHSWIILDKKDSMCDA